MQSEAGAENAGARLALVRGAKFSLCPGCGVTGGLDWLVWCQVWEWDRAAGRGLCALEGLEHGAAPTTHPNSIHRPHQGRHETQAGVASALNVTGREVYM